MKENKQKNKILSNRVYYSKGEEWFNIISHLAAAVLSVVAAALMIVRVLLKAHKGEYKFPALAIVSVAIFGLVLIIMYLFSTLYHSRNQDKKARVVLRRFDHCSIPLLIAGTYAPYMFIGLCEKGLYQPADTVWGIVIASVVLATAVLTVIFNAINPQKFRKFGMIAYLTMGWCIVIRILPVVRAVGRMASLFLMFGGIMYTTGVLFYSSKKIKFNHAVWHLFVIAGSVFHFVSVYVYLI